MQMFFRNHALMQNCDNGYMTLRNGVVNNMAHTKGATNLIAEIQALGAINAYGGVFCHKVNFIIKFIQVIFCLLDAPLL